MSRVAGALLGIFSAFALFFGIINISAVTYEDAIQRRGGVNTAADFYEAILLLLIGAFSGFFAARWMTDGRSKDVPPENQEISNRPTTWPDG